MPMATDDERRDVARRLRELVPCLFDDGEYIDCGEVEEALGLVNDDSAWYKADGVMRLADLIEPAPKCSEVAPKCDRDALLALADDLGNMSDELPPAFRDMGTSIANRIREACGVEDG